MRLEQCERMQIDAFSSVSRVSSSHNYCRPRYIALNLLALSIHAGSAFRLILLNRSSLALHLNPVPVEFSRIPYAVAASDFARLALLAKHGGLYIDADFLVMRSLASVRRLLETYDTVTYEAR